MTLADLVVIDMAGGRSMTDHSRMEPAIGAFTAGQSVVVFPLAISIVVTVTRASRTVVGTAFDSVFIPLAASIIVGCTLFVITVRDRRARPRTAAQWIRTATVAFLNSLVLFAAALGIEKF
jgi:hypothetical protein